MTYLVILVVVAAAGILRLWLQQRRQRAHLATADQFQVSLARLSTHRTPRARRALESPRSHPRSGRRPQPLDPARREAAKRRLEARRRARAN